MRKQKAEHPPHITNVHAGVVATGLGWKVKSTKHGFISAQLPKVATLVPDMAALHNIKKVTLETASECCSQESRKMFVGGMSTFDFGGGAKCKRGYDTFMRCEEYSIAKGTNAFYCNDVKGFL